MPEYRTATRLVLGSAALVLGLCPLAKAEKEPPVLNGEKVQINYVCRLKNGEVAAATYRDAVLKPEEKRSGIYLELKNDAPLEWAAGQKKAAQDRSAPFDFADAIADQLGSSVVGLSPGQVHSIEIAAEKTPARPGGAIRLARVRRRPREQRMTAEEYRGRTGKDPEVGQELTFDPAVPGEVVAVNGPEVVVKYRAPVGGHVETPFGRALVKSDDHHYLLEIEIEKGALVRSGPMVGRVVEVDDRFFTVDYGHPLAGEDLVCDVTVARGEER
jgi:FKBP-type peptidyl-prolyl cis-trans isomerase 2